MTTAAATVRAGLCIGCGLCRAACPYGAIRLTPGRDRVARPVLDRAACTGCGLCARFCPNAPAELAARAQRAAAARGAQPLASDGVTAHCFLAWDARDADGRRRSASGGLATALARHLLASGAIDAVLHARRTLSGRGRPHGAATVSRTPADLDAGRGSIYEPIDFSDALLSLAAGGRYFMTGTPCVIRGAKRLFAEHPRYRTMRLYTCALVCSHNVTPQFADYFADRKRIPRSAAYTVDFRDKTGIPDAGNFNSRYTAPDGADLHRANRNKNGWTRLWRSYAFAVPVCCRCPDFWCVEADISVKDAWGKKEWTADPLGKSVAILRVAPSGGASATGAADTGTDLLAAFQACGFAGAPLEPAEVAQMQKPQLVYKLDGAADKFTRPVFAPANVRSGHFRNTLTAWFSRTAYAFLGAFATAAGLKLLAPPVRKARARRFAF